ncbi:cysteine hydrolase family protein [Parachitinimonas caeni]|uniref:Isochorismatase family protein n=1 Tax=Parachitinimonas caeni TaxID=3031301 RepID=A0ABT7DT14_9NEIS|nr:isochorismatase family protein [Parachitinimonas caeni]MDK2123200.1 isochorismatase family protein [Parachitinimonas caeni]
MTAQTALIVIDVQQSFENYPHWREDDVPAFREAISTLIDGCAAKGVPVVRVFHVEDEGPFSKASGWVKAIDWLPGPIDAQVEKRVHNALTDSGLREWLDARGIRKLIISGIRTEQCCETTARVASDLGYQVDYVTEATLTFPMKHANGRVFSTAEIKEKTELVLAGRFATIKTVAQCLSDLN